MPGFIINIGGNKPRIKEALDTLKFDDRFECRLLFEDPETQIFFNAYRDYPCTVFENDSFFCLVEGHVYNTTLNEEVDHLFKLLVNGSFLEIGAHVKKLDGEFVFCFYLKDKKQIILINDAWARLPVYYTMHEGGAIMSREISIVKSFLSDPKISKVDAALYAMFGYSLGENTIYAGISKVAPLSVATVSGEESRIQINTFFNFEFLRQPSEPIDYTKLIQSVEAAILQRISLFEKPSLSLSGGLDSRLIAGLIAKRNFPVAFTTYAFVGAHEALDLSGAKEISHSLKWDEHHKIVTLKKPTISDEKYLANIKQGLNGLDMAFIIPYLRAILKVNDCLLTGDGGDKFFEDLHPLVHIKSKKQLIRYLLKHHTQLLPETAGEIFGVSATEILGRIDAVIESYDLSNLSDAFAAFQIKERGMNWLFEGEDRNRYFIWSTSPFYNPDVIKEAMSLSMANKQHGALFQDLFALIPGNLERIVNPNWKLPLEAKKEINWVFKKQKLKTFVPSYLFTRKTGKLKASRLFVKWNRQNETSVLNLSSVKNSRINPIVMSRLETILDQF